MPLGPGSLRRRFNIREDENAIRQSRAADLNGCSRRVEFSEFHWRKVERSAADVVDHIGVDSASQKTNPERAPRNETDAQFLTERKDPLLRPTPQQRIFVLNCGYTLFGVRTAQHVGTHLAQTPV